MVMNIFLMKEPGYYEQGKYGIRIENLILCKKINEEFYGFENLTMCPYDRNLFDFSQL